MSHLLYGLVIAEQDCLQFPVNMMYHIPIDKK